MIVDKTCCICFNQPAGLCKSIGISELFEYASGYMTSAEKFACTNCGVYYIANGGGEKLMELGVLENAEIRLAVSSIIKNEPGIVIVNNYFLENHINNITGKLNYKFKSAEELYQNAKELHENKLKKAS